VCGRRSGRLTLERSTCQYSLQRREWSTTQSRTVRDLGAEAAPSLRTSGRSASGARMAREGAESHLLRRRPRSGLLGEIPSGRRVPRVCLGVGRPPKTPLVDVEP
jgi:hypothetical protein